MAAVVTPQMSKRHLSALISSTLSHKRFFCIFSLLLLLLLFFVRLQRRQYQTDMVRQKNQSVEDVHKRDSVRTAMLVNRSGVHRVTRKAGMPESR